MEKSEIVLEFYVKTSLLNNLCGEKENGRRLSISESVYKSQMLAIALYEDNKLEYDRVDLAEAITMIALSHIFVVDDAFNYNDPFQSSVLDKLRMRDDLKCLLTRLYKVGNDETAIYARDVLALTDKINNNQLMYNTRSGRRARFDIGPRAFYAEANKLRTIIRTGWKDWKVKANRLESVAEHVISTQMLALAIYSEYPEQFSDIDIKKTLLMIAVHELGEAKIGDLTIFQIKKENKKVIERAAVDEMTSNLKNGHYIKNIHLEFDDRSSREGIFGHWCDKEDCVLRANVYDELRCIDLDDQEDNYSYHDDNVQRLLAKNWSFGKLFIDFWNEKVNYAEPFLEVSDYAYNHEITDLLGR